MSSTGLETTKAQTSLTRVFFVPFLESIISRGDRVVQATEDINHLINGNQFAKGSFLL